MDGMKVDALREALASLEYGKRLPTAIYVWDEDGGHLPAVLQGVCRELRRRLELDGPFNVIKFHTDRAKVSFLSYPTFIADPHPALEESVIVDLVTGAVRRDHYGARANPPILHRKEAFLPPGHPKARLFGRLTAEEERAGLLTETSRIGFRLNWEKLMAERGYRLAGHRLVRAESDDGVGGTLPAATARGGRSVRVERHRTALVRGEISKPVKLLLECGQLRAGETLFDYGCGHGTDVRALGALGYAASGWDPVHAPEGALQAAPVVNLGFVLNVIEDPAERVEVLHAAWKLAGRLLVVSTLVRGQEAYADFQCFGDGVLTSRNTFQKYFEPAEIQALIEDSLGVEAIPVALGIYFVFRDVAEGQDFLSQRTQRYLDWEILSGRLGLRGVLRQRKDPYLAHRELLDEFWQAAVALGRIPREGEYDRIAEVRRACGSVPKAMALFVERYGQQAFEAARLKRREDTLVYVAAARLRRRVPFTKLSPRLQRDIQSFFGSYPEAERQAMDVMFAAGDVDELALAVARLGFGWWDEQERQFTIHRSLLDDLPVILRIYAECGARLFGNPREADLIKFHLRSRKLTFQHYDDFDGSAFPELKLRIKIDLPRMFVTVFDQARFGERQILYFKDRFVAPGHPGRSRWEQVGRRLRALGFDPETIGHGPPREAFARLLDERGLKWDLSRR